MAWLNSNQYKGICPQCGVERLIQRLNNNVGWWCNHDHYVDPLLLPLGAEAPADLQALQRQDGPRSSVVVAGVDIPEQVNTSEIPIDETRRFDRLSPFQKIEKKLNANSGTDRPKPTKYFCSQCGKDRLTFGTHCPKCKSLMVHPDASQP